MASGFRGTAASFGDSLRLFAEKSTNVTLAVVDLADDIAFDSVTIGSGISGAPGQPVDTGDLFRSWKRERLSRWDRVMYSKLVYAWGIENAIGPHGPITLRSLVGGFHSVKLTVAAWQRIVEFAARSEAGAV